MSAPLLSMRLPLCFTARSTDFFVLLRARVCVSLKTVSLRLQDACYFLCCFMSSMRSVVFVTLPIFQPIADRTSRKLSKPHENMRLLKGKFCFPPYVSALFEGKESSRNFRSCPPYPVRSTRRCVLMARTGQGSKGEKP